MGKSIGTNTPVPVAYTYWESQRNSSGQTKYQTTKIKTETIGNITYAYTYDNVGNLTSILETQNGTTTQTASYVYDQLNQLVRENDSYQNKTIIYTYDANGNLQTVTTYPYTTDSLGTAISTNTYSYEDAEWGDLLTAYNVQSLTYDTIGNPLTWRDDMTMTWQDGRRLSSLQTNGKNIQYTYDADGLRVTKTVDGIKHTYQYVGGLLVYETRGDISFAYDYDAYGHLSCIQYMWADGSSWKFYVACNSRGDVTAIYAADGTLRAKYTYDSWGNTLSIIDRYGNDIVALGDDAIAADNIGALNRIRYRGYYYDSESGLYYLQSRYYDPQVKRFLNADGYVSTGQGLLASNMFAYCGNNPISRVDDGGTVWWTAVSAIVGGIVSGVAKTIANVSCGKKWNDGLVGAVVGGIVYGGIIASTGDVVTAGFASAAAESITNQVMSYTPTFSQINGQSTVKEVTPENIEASMRTIAYDTAINGSINTLTGTLAGKIVPISNNLSQPNTLLDSLIGEYALKSGAQTVVQSTFIASIEVTRYYTKQAFQGYKELIESIAEQKEELKRRGCVA